MNLDLRDVPQMQRVFASERVHGAGGVGHPLGFLHLQVAGEHFSESLRHVRVEPPVLQTRSCSAARRGNPCMGAACSRRAWETQEAGAVCTLTSVEENPESLGRRPYRNVPKEPKQLNYKKRHSSGKIGTNSLQTAVSCKRH